MKLPSRLLHPLRRRLLALAASRLPDEVIGKPDSPYLLRWHIVGKNRFFNLYLHSFKRSDDERALHDHPWINLSLLLSGSYLEHTKYAPFRIRLAGDLVFRLPRTAHRIQLGRRAWDSPVWTLFITGPVVREWGFHCPAGWRHWRHFTSADGLRVGRGCD